MPDSSLAEPIAAPPPEPDGGPVAGPPHPAPPPLRPEAARAAPAPPVPALPPPPVVQDEARKRADLARMKRLALAALGAAAVGFLVAHVAGRGLAEGSAAAFWLGLLASIFEAAMVGALADWFAVTALFRHPMGIPIPHTAIIPENKDRIGGSLGRFVGTNFLSTENVLARLQHVNVAEAAGEWLQTPGHVREVGRRVAALAIDAAEGMEDERIREFVGREVVPKLKNVALAPRLSQALLGLTKDDHHEALLDEALRAAGQLAHANRETIRGVVRAQVPRFVPNAVVELVNDALVRQLDQTVVAMVEHRDHPLRLQIHGKMAEFIARLETDPALQARVDAWRDRLVQNEAVHAFALDRWGELRAFLARDLRDEDSRIFGWLEGRAAGLGRSMLRDEAFQRAVNEKAREAVAWALREHGHRVPELIQDTIRRWDSEKVTEQIELAVGRDLQYIRLNGTLVGGLVGGLLYLLTTALG